VVYIATAACYGVVIAIDNRNREDLPPYHVRLFHRQTNSAFYPSNLTPAHMTFLGPRVTPWQENEKLRP
jgi:hypothetical protein